jgi:hypothetical protein
MAGKTLDITKVITPDSLACEIADKWQEWDSLRQGKKEEWQELRNYVYATDTRTTSNAKLDWCNSTTTPKLTQIKDNLHANYFAALFPSSNWMEWSGDERDAVTLAKTQTIEAYMENKVRQSKFVDEVSLLLDDWILFGNCFAMVQYENNIVETSKDVVVNYVGPKVYRISPYDIVFNPVASSFDQSPKIIKSILTLGEMKKMTLDGDPKYQEVFDRMLTARRTVAAFDGTTEKNNAFMADGFSSIQQYYGSAFVEILTYYGDIYDQESDTLHTNKIITIADRAYILSIEDNESWFGKAPIFHCGWRNRPDNLYAMGPLDNLVGMQYRIDHLENLKADVFDQIALPMMKIRGEVEDFTQAPGERIILGEEGDVAYLAPDTTALNADFQIANLMDKMEQMAGAPREAMGIRTPGEKTAYEVQSLLTGASRIFEHKAGQFERTFIEPILNTMLEMGRRIMNTADKIRISDPDTGAYLFEEITREDITAAGKIVPMGARHFAETAKRVQQLNVLMQQKLADPTMGVHISGKRLAQLVTRELGEEALFESNVQVAESMETQRTVQETQVQMEDEQMQAAEMGL